ncbi:MAG: hypothetical protein Q9217_002846, partial [Psora testacea]
ACFIIVIFSIWLQCLWGNNYVTPEDVVHWTPSHFYHAIEGAKWGVAMETLKITCVWGCKTCLLILYANMTKLALVGVFSLGILVILCAILNRITNFTAPYGSLIYLNWYAGEAATAVIVANVPHLWPLISRVFNLGAFKQISGQNGSKQYPLRSHRSGVGITTVRRNNYDSDGYIPTSSQERIAVGGHKDGQWGYGKNIDTVESGDADLEMVKGYTTTRVQGGPAGGNGGGGGDDGDGVGPVGIAVEDNGASGWEDERADLGREGQIVKTVHINQYASDR